MLSRACQIGIRATLYLTLRSGATYVTTPEISGVLKESYHFVAKVLHQLAGAGLLHSYRGPNGGVTLSKSPEKIVLNDIIIAIDGKGTLENCVLGRHDCSTKSPCALHEDWSPIRNQIMALVKQHSLQEVAQRITLDAKSDEDLKSMLDTYLRQVTL